MQTATARYETLDGLRGVAAFGVMVFHFSILGIHGLLPRGFLAVDLFFVLSGFALSCAYEKTAHTLPVAQFAKKRLIRLIPLSVFGLTLGTLYFLARVWVQPGSLYTPQDVSLSYLFNLFLLPKPWVTAAPTDTVFPANTPLWSLSLEMIVNLVWAAALIRWSTRRLWATTAVAGALLAAVIMAQGTADLGATWPTYVGGVLRASFGFCAGILIWRHHPKTSPSRIVPPVGIAVLLATFAFPGGGAVFETLAIVVIMPSLIYLTVRADCRKPRLTSRRLGQLSYSLYTIHVPFLMIVVGALKQGHIDNPSMPIVLLCGVAIVLAAFALDKYYDAPVRSYVLTRATISGSWSACSRR